MIRRFTKRIERNGTHSLIHDSRGECRMLTEYCNMLAEKVDELVVECNRLRSIVIDKDAK